jgi:hypothetical protein
MAPTLMGVPVAWAPVPLAGLLEPVVAWVLEEELFDVFLLEEHAATATAVDAASATNKSFRLTNTWLSTPLLGSRMNRERTRYWIR